jgi:glycosyltransferase involved in cell wall biosynthesis
MKPLVSILMPVYNAGPWIADAIKSALQQTWERKEVIIVHDGSTDQTLSIARQFASKSTTVVTQPNQGASAARNKAFSICQGDYIQWLDADDLLAPDKIARQMKAAEQCQNQRTLFSGSWGQFMYRPSRAKFSPTPLWCDLSPLEWLLRKMGQSLHMQPDSWLVSRELTEAAGPWDTRLWRDNDGEYFCRVILSSDFIRFIPEARSYYRDSGSSSVSHIGHSNQKLESLSLSIQLHISYLRSLDDSEKIRRSCVNYLQTWLESFYPERPDIVNQLEELAASLGGHLEAPRLSWKYAWIQKNFGWTAAKQAQLRARRYKADLLRSWDKAMLCLNRGSSMAAPYQLEQNHDAARLQTS